MIILAVLATTLASRTPLAQAQEINAPQPQAQRSNAPQVQAQEINAPQPQRSESSAPQRKRRRAALRSPSAGEQRSAAQAQESSAPQPQAQESSAPQPQAQESSAPQAQAQGSSAPQAKRKKGANSRRAYRLRPSAGAALRRPDHQSGRSACGWIFRLGSPLRKWSHRLRLEFVPQYNATGQRLTSLTIHPGLIYSLGHGFAVGGRLAFVVDNPTLGFTPLVNKSWPIKQTTACSKLTSSRQPASSFQPAGKARRDQRCYIAMHFEWLSERAGVRVPERTPRCRKLGSFCNRCEAGWNAVLLASCIANWRVPSRLAFLPSPSHSGARPPGRND